MSIIYLLFAKVVKKFKIGLKIDNYTFFLHLKNINMNTKILSVILVFFSIIGGIVWSMLSNTFLWGAIGELGGTKTVFKTSKNIEITDLQNTITKLVKEVSPSVVSIIIKKDLTLYRRDDFWFFQEPVGTVRQKVGGGSGFFITKDGKILTNKHVVADGNAEYVVVTNDGKEYEASVLARDPLTDLAVIQIKWKADFIPLEFVSKDDEINIWEFAIAIGNPLAEFQNSVSLWVVSGKNRSINEGEVQLSNLIQTDAAINPWNSGGPLLNLDKKVMAINSAIVNGTEWLWFALAMSREKVDYMLSSIQKYGSIKKPFIWISSIALSPRVSQELKVKSDYGALIDTQKDSVLTGSPADVAGLKPGDIILKIDGEKLDMQNDLPSMIQNKIPWEKLELEVFDSKGNTKNVEVILGEK